MSKSSAARSYEHLLGDSRQAALEEAMDRYSGWLLWYFNSLCGDAHEAENRVQELWIYVYQKFPEDKMSHAGFLKRKAWQIYVDWKRKRGARDFLTYTDHTPDNHTATFFPEPSSDKEESALADRFWENFPNLTITGAQKQAFWLKCRHGHTIEEVADIMDIATSTAHDWISLVKERCAEYLNQEEQA